jgi:anti-sigma B factor antagonist
MDLAKRAYANILVLSPKGRLDHDNCDAFQAGVRPHVDALAPDSGGIVFDLSNLEYVSSAGLRCFMLAARQARARQARIVIAAMRPVVSEIFQISRFNLVFDVYPSVRDALATISPSAHAEFDKS